MLPDSNCRWSPTNAGLGDNDIIWECFTVSSGQWLGTKLLSAWCGSAVDKWALCALVHSPCILLQWFFSSYFDFFFFQHKLNIRQSCANLITLRNYLGRSDLGIILSSFIPINDKDHKSPSICFGRQWHSGNAMQGSPSCKSRLGSCGQWSQQCEKLLPKNKQRQLQD